MERVDKFIEGQLRREPSPTLERQIMANLERREAIRVSPWYRVGVAMAVAVVTALALFIGSTVNYLEESSEGLVVNDYYLEQLALFISEGDGKE